jgi:thioredoxin-like negative regulator of GroEL
MMTKIEWYQEVLALEPSSKVFFPLAKLLIENGEFDESCRILSQGVDRHPEYVEAKLLLVDVLHRLGRTEDARKHVLAVGTQMAAYPDFWRQWAQILSGQDKGRDIGLALQFLAASFHGAPISWGEVLEHGLRAVIQNGPSSAFSEEAPVSTHGRVTPSPLPPAEAPRHERAQDQLPESQAQPLVSPLIENLTARVLSEEPPAGEPDEDADEETFSLRTRTMADLLAEQGDLAGALDIYRELHAGAESDEEKNELARRIDKMAARMQEIPAKGAAMGGADEDVRPPAPEAGGLHSKKKLMNALEKLAQRLEARAAN